MTFITGAFTSSFTPAGGGAASLGQTKEGFEITSTPHTEPIRVNEWGQTIVDEIHMGADVTVKLDFAEYELAKLGLYAAHPQGVPKTNVGKLMSSLAGQLVLTPVAGTTAAAASGAYTFYLCYCISDIQELLKHGEKTGPLTFRVLPSTSNSNKHFVVAAP